MATLSSAGQRIIESQVHYGMRGSSIDCISLLQELAFEEPSERGGIVKRLENYASGRRGRAGTAAQRAAANIIAVSMMEIFHEL